ncbi:unnamed protein product [Mytilus edulis]|uniref:Uncharacterized protein n=1 Tax=Mytilus edulis TaxID=6550 RepID=A0A8S3SXW0_MYTED|nr:unnamed protein product [Mytilus edulis]
MDVKCVILLLFSLTIGTPTSQHGNLIGVNDEQKEVEQSEKISKLEAIVANLMVEIGQLKTKLSDLKDDTDRNAKETFTLKQKLIHGKSVTNSIPQTEGSKSPELIDSKRGLKPVSAYDHIGRETRLLLPGNTDDGKRTAFHAFMGSNEPVTAHWTTMELIVNNSVHSKSFVDGSEDYQVNGATAISLVYMTKGATAYVRTGTSTNSHLQSVGSIRSDDDVWSTFSGWKISD